MMTMMMMHLERGVSTQINTNHYYNEVWCQPDGAAHY